MNVLILQGSPRANGSTAWMAEEFKKAQIQAAVQRIYNMNKPAKVKKMALLLSSYSPDVYDGATAQYRGICSYWGVEDKGIVTAKIDEQKTDETLAKVRALAAKL